MEGSGGLAAVSSGISEGLVVLAAIVLLVVLVKVGKLVLAMFS
jgi:hypothetical protein